MSPAKLDPALAELIESRRLGSLEQSRHRFTVSREEGLLRLREQIRARDASRWAWTLFVVRAANALSDHAAARIEVEELEADAQAQRITTLDVIVPGIELDALDLSDLLAGALAPDLGRTLERDDPGPRFERFRLLIGRALNGALAHEPLSLELETVAGGRRFERREQAVEGRDPYLERKIAGSTHASRFVVRLREARPSLGSRLGRWLRGRGKVDDELMSLWREHQVREGEAGEPLANHEASEDGSVSLGPSLRRPRLAFDTLAHYWPGPVGETPTLWLIRDGLRLIDIGPALFDQDIELAGVAGFVDCPRLRLTADERGIVRDARFEQLVAWLHDYRDQLEREPRAKPEQPDEPDASVDGAAPESGFGARTLAAGVQAANGRTISVDELAESAHRGRELVYVWRHQARSVPAWARSRTAALWPSEELQLRRHLSELRLVPLRALGQTDVDPADLTSLRAGCFEPIALVNAAPLELGERPSAFGALVVSVEAFIHRAPTASQGFVVILAYERRVAQFHERGAAFPGVTLVARVANPDPSATLDVAALRKDSATVAAIAELCREQTRRHWEALLTHVMRRANPWENPLVRSCLLELRAQTINLCYRPTDAGLRLSWTDTVLLDVEIGHDQEGQGSRKTLRDALRNVRERGFVVLAHPHKRHSSLRSTDPLLQPWRLDDDNTRALLARVVGHAAVLDMPVVVEAHPRVVAEPVEDQRHLLRERATIERERGRSATDPLARQRLIGHLLVARGLDQSAMGLETLPLFERYDPRAQHPTRLVSLDAALAEQPRPGLVPSGAVDRELPRPMLEVNAGVAALLAEVADFEPGETSTAIAEFVADASAAARPSERSTSTPVRRRGRAAEPMLARTVASPLAIGRLQVAADASSAGIGLWAGGLRVGELQLPEPLGRVSGRLVLSAQGRRVGSSAIRELATAEARTLIAQAPRQRILSPPGSAQRERLDHFVAYLRSILAVDDRFGLGPALGLEQSEARGDRALALREASLRAAPLRPLRQRDALLVEVIRQSLAMRVSFDTAMLSWRPAKLRRRRGDGSFELEFGLRNRWIQQALDEGRKLEAEDHRRAALFAGLFVVTAFFEQAGERDDVELGPEHLIVALWRLLSLV